jgi:serine/threonine protein kinase
MSVSFTSCGTVKLIDFGLCTSVRRSESCLGLYSLTGQTGTMRYMAPEVMCSLHYSEKVDIYSFSLIAWQVLTGLVPYASCDRSDHRHRVCELGDRPDISLALQRTNDESISYQLNRLLAACWHTDPRERLDILDIYNDLSGLHILQSRIEIPSLRRRHLPSSHTWLQRSLSGL